MIFIDRLTHKDTVFEAAAPLIDLGPMASLLIERSYRQYLQEYTQIKDQLILFLNNIVSLNEAALNEQNFLPEMANFRKTLNVYISIIVHSADVADIPLNLGQFSHLLGQIKDAMLAGVPLQHQEIQSSAYELLRILDLDVLIKVLPLNPQAAKLKQDQIITIIRTLASQERLLAQDYHLLRKRLRSFAHCYSVLVEEKYRQDNEGEELNLAQLSSTHELLLSWTKNLGHKHDTVVEQAMHESATNGHTFAEIYQQQYMSLGRKTRQGILKYFK